MPCGTPTDSGEPRVDHQVAVLAVDRHEVLGLQQALDDLQLFAAGVAAHVDVRDAVVEHIGAEPEEVVDVPVDGCLVARDRAWPRARPCRPSSIVMWRWSPLAMRVSALVGSPWLPVVTTTSRSMGVFRISSTPTITPSGSVQVAELPGHRHVVDHRAAGHEHLAAA